MNLWLILGMLLSKGGVSFDVRVMNGSRDSLTVFAMVINQSENMVQVPKYFGPAGWGLEVSFSDSEAIKDNGRRVNPWWKGGFVEVVPGGAYGRIICLSDYYKVTGDSLKAVFRLKSLSNPFSMPGFVGIDVSSDAIDVRLKKK